jgi:formylglycine-generating enzyme required for sulfatase activity
VPLPPQLEKPEPLNMARIPGGTFTMGRSADEADTDELGMYFHEEPRHQVTISPFYMGKYPVTQAEYRAVMGANPSRFKGDNLPVEQVNWFDAVEYCNRWW